MATSTKKYRLTAEAAKKCDFDAIMKAIHTLQGAGLLAWKATTEGPKSFAGNSVNGLVPTVQVKLVNTPSLELLLPNGGIWDANDELGLKKLYAKVEPTWQERLDRLAKDHKPTSKFIGSIAGGRREGSDVKEYVVFGPDYKPLKKADGSIAVFLVHEEADAFLNAFVKTALAATAGK